MPQPTTLVDSRGQQVQLGRLLGQGGEAAVFEIVGAPGMVAKRYHTPPDTLRAAKLAHMVGRASASLLQVAAWPMAILHERQNGRPVGFAMAKLDDVREVHVLFSRRDRQQACPKADWQFLIHTAMNCAAAFDTLHRAGVVIGDVNSKNVLFSPRDATIRLVDCDSFQLDSPSERYLCGVGVPEYTPPELQERSLAGVERTINHDLFGLAVMVFQLLFLGRHPFSGVPHYKGEVTLERSIRELRFAFGRMASAKQVSLPPNTLELAAVSSATAELFEVAFSESAARGGRPSAADWVKQLRILGAQLRRCNVDAMHKYAATGGACPWCQLEATGVAHFPGTQQPSTFSCSVTELDSSLMVLEQVLAALVAGASGQRSPKQLPQVIAVPLCEAEMQSWQLMRVSSFLCVLPVLIMGVALLMGGIPLVTNPWLAAGLGSGLTSAFLWRQWLGSESVFGRARLSRQSALDEAQRNVWEAAATLAEAQRAQAAFLSESQQQGAHLQQRYGALELLYHAERGKLLSEARASQLRAFLDSHSLQTAQIRGIGSARRASLNSYGVDTAFDVLHGNLGAVPGIGEKLQQEIEAWARSIERRFQFDRKRGISEAEQRAVAARYRRTQLALRGELEQLVAVAKARAPALAATYLELDQRMAVAEAQLGQAQADAALLQ